MAQLINSSLNTGIAQYIDHLGSYVPRTSATSVGYNVGYDGNSIIVGGATDAFVCTSSDVGLTWDTYEGTYDGVSHHVVRDNSIRYSVQVRFPVLRGLLTDNNVLNMPKLMRHLKEQAAVIIQSQLPPQRIALHRPLTSAMIAEDGLPIEAAIRVVERSAKVDPTEIHQTNETMDHTTQTLTLTFSYFHKQETTLDMSVSEDFIRQCDREKTLEEMKGIIRKRHKTYRNGPSHGRSAPIPMTAIQANEIKARETLRDMITESEWRRYLTNGFIMVKAPSGLHYQIFGRGDNLKVYKDNKQIESICIHTDKECPPTDHVINIKVLLEIDEQAVRSGGNIRAVQTNDNVLGISRDQIRDAMDRHIRGALGDQAVNEANRKRDRSAELQSLRRSSESLVSIYQKLKTG